MFRNGYGGTRLAAALVRGGSVETVQGDRASRRRHAPLSAATTSGATDILWLELREDPAAVDAYGARPAPNSGSRAPVQSTCAPALLSTPSRCCQRKKITEMTAKKYNPPGIHMINPPTI